ncbi:MAG: hypothetical protein LAN71_16955 [Acidobacteriia bacterium]|nr:hypothetical protein [Terriglobia bacterium]
MSNTLDQVFHNLNECYFLGKQKLLFDIFHEEIRKAANAYFCPGQSHADHDAFFGRFTTIWLDLVRKRRYFEAIRVWNIALQLAFEWERNNGPHVIHKGTPYYFLGVTALLNNELENGFLLMHQALEEDKRALSSQTPPTPAYFFATLDYAKQGQFFRPKVEEISRYLSERIDVYSGERNGSLTIDQFKKKFLECTNLEEEVFLLVFLLFELKKLIVDTGAQLKQNVFSSLIHTKVLFDSCLVVEKAIEFKNPHSKTGAKLYFSDEIKFLSQKSSSSIGDATVAKLNLDFKADFSKTIGDIIGSKYTLPMSDIESDFSIAYGIRNFAAHRIEDQPVLYKNMEEIVQRLLNVLFFTVEKLY